MQPFLFYVNDGLGAATPTFQLEGFESLEAAVAYAQSLLDREQRYQRITIADADRELALIERGGRAAP